ncbi:hypothetical protein [Heyndrickxia oleronia]|uniref:hypothetical protein n=1 Tax=Heyndrickxia oleronia TaxID=38875 RepID=UPI0037524409
MFNNFWANVFLCISLFVFMIFYVIQHADFFSIYNMNDYSPFFILGGIILLISLYAIHVCLYLIDKVFEKFTKKKVF